MKKPFFYKYRGTFTDRYINFPSKFEVFKWVCMWIGFMWMLLWGFSFLLRAVEWLVTFI